ncbi:MAG: hypothetical protein JST69_13235 [Bacteroidetes bacterium]|nr:hypothetical protein [Bacteroidota bacterium]
MNKNVLLFTVCWLLLVIILGLTVNYAGKNTFTFPILLVVAGATWVIYFLINRTPSEKWVKNYLLSIVLKLLLGGGFISILIFVDKTHANANALFFMIAYFMFTGLEVSFLLKRFN